MWSNMAKSLTHPSSHVHVTMSSVPASTDEKDPIKNSQKKWQHYCSYYKSLKIFSTVCGRIGPNFKFLGVLMHVIITCRYEKN